jgi:hypothetical protein
VLAETDPQGYTPLPDGWDQAKLWAVLQELANLDIANTTPVQALVLLNELQSKLNQA